MLHVSDITGTCSVIGVTCYVHTSYCCFITNALLNVSISFIYGLFSGSFICLCYIVLSEGRIVAEQCIGKDLKGDGCGQI